MSVPETSNEEKIAALLRLMEISQHLAATVDLQELLSRIEHAARELLQCDRATVFVYDSPVDELYSFVADRSEQIRFPANKGLAGECFLTGKLTHTPDAYADERFNRAVDAETGYRTRNILTCPLTTIDQTQVGVLQALNKEDGPFTPWDETLMRTLSAQCGVALQRQFLLEEFAHKQRIQRELTLARDIQQGLLPDEAPQAEGCDIAAWNRPADETGGDFYYFQALPDGRLFFVLADVTGHGIAAALLASQSYALFRASVTPTADAGETATHVNRLLSDDIPIDRFVTAFVGVLDPAAHQITYSAAGHGPVYLVRESGEAIELDVQGPPLGIDETFVYEVSDPLPFGPTDTIFICTDGFFEWDNAAHEPFGTDRMCKLISQLQNEPAADVISGVYQAVFAHANGNAQSDDLTAIAIKRKVQAD